MSKKKPIPDTVLVQCEHCDLIMRVEEHEVEAAVELPTFCHLVKDDDVEERKRKCQSARFKKPKGI